VSLSSITLSKRIRPQHCTGKASADFLACFVRMKDRIRLLSGGGNVSIQWRHCRRDVEVSPPAAWAAPGGIARREELGLFVFLRPLSIAVNSAGNSVIVKMICFKTQLL
jgi:hypothetical protein